MSGTVPNKAVSFGMRLYRFSQEEFMNMTIHCSYSRPCPECSTARVSRLSCVRCNGKGWVRIFSS